KTSICVAILEVLKQRGFRVAAMKPVASGGTKTASGILNLDAQRIREHINTSHDYRTINPVSLYMPAAPIIAAKKEHTRIEAGPILEGYNRLSEGADVVLVEGVGGWHVQLNESLWMADLVKLLNLPVIMVVGMRLGCINHAILTAEAIVNAGCRLYGWIGNQIDCDYQNYEETLALLAESIEATMLAAVPYVPQADIEQMVPCLKDIYLPEI
ncbi:MAG: ATP-dependent dethiobiotin synthetase BioD, partial [Gammaproteobacteria bacterium]|nr:ATP-dependent dethiobiotin synthetase BioD [Gammaproteobacteria bacterium]